MSTDYTIALKKARLAAGLTQEQAAEAANVSVESWKAYEYGLRIPPGETAGHICGALDAPWLALEWLQLSGGALGVLPEGIRVQELPTAAMQLINRVWNFADRHRDRQLMAIAEDGVIDRGEREEFHAILDDLDGIIRAALQVKFTTARRAKRNRSGLRQPEREAMDAKAPSEDKPIIPQSAEKARPIFLKRGGAV